MPATDRELIERARDLAPAIRNRAEEACRETANRMMAAAGASSFHLDQPLQRIWRDINTVCSHAFWDWDVTCEITGREHLGLPLNHPLV